MTDRERAEGGGGEREGGRERERERERESIYIYFIHTQADNRSLSITNAETSCVTRLEILSHITHTHTHAHTHFCIIYILNMHRYI